ncbi:MAG: hypothetical protein ABJE47_23905 [bacterium]
MSNPILLAMPVCRAFNVRVAGFLATLALSASCWSHQPSLVGQVAEGPVALIGVPENRLIRWPSVAVLSDTVFVAANIFPIVGDSLDARPAYLGRLRQNPAGDLVSLGGLDLPPGDFQFAYPRIIQANGRLHLVWAEFRSPPRMSFAWPPSIPTSLWQASLANGSWSVPERVATSQWFGWNDETGGIAVDARGALHIAIWTGDSVARVRHIRLADGQWDASLLPVTGLNHTTAIATYGDTVIVGYVDAVIDTERVMLVQSTDQVTHWKNAVVASQRVGGFVTSLAIATTTEGYLVAIGEKAPDSFYLDTIRVLRSTGAIGPSVTQLIAPPPTSDGFALALASCGSAVMLIRTFSLTPQIFELTIPRDAPITMSRPLLRSAAAAVFPGIAASGRSAIAVFAYTSASDTPARSVAMTLPGCVP